MKLFVLVAYFVVVRGLLLSSLGWTSGAFVAIRKGAMEESVYGVCKHGTGTNVN